MRVEKMIRNQVKEVLGRGEVTLGTWITTASPDVAEIMANMGFDCLVFDTEHAPLSIETVQNLIQATNGSGTFPIVRVAWNDQVLIKRALDIGAYGLIVPWVNSKEDAVMAVRAAKYPPTGIRGIGPRRASNYYQNFKDYFEGADEEIMVVVQIEHIDAVDNVDEIVSVEGIDVFFIGPADLTASMGLFGKYNHPKVVQAMDKVLNSIKDAGVPAGIHAFDIEDAIERISQGFQFILVGTDIGFLIQGCAETLKKISKKNKGINCLVD